MFDEVCPYCQTPKCIPDYVKRHIKTRGSCITNFQCCHCNQTVKAFGFRTVHFGIITKSDKSDFESREN